MSLARSMSWMGGAQVATVILQFAASIVVARFLSPREMGIYAIAAALVGLISIIQTLGLQALIVREETLTDAVSDTAFTVNAVIGVTVAAVVLAIALVGPPLAPDPDVRRVLLALALSPFFGIFDFLPAARLERAGAFSALARVGMASSLFSTIATIAFAAGGARYMTAAWSGWVAAGTYALGVNLAGRKYARFRFSLQGWRRVADFGFNSFATLGLHTIGARLSDVCLAKFQGLAGLGIYGRASNLNGLLWNNVHMVMARVLLVEFAEIHRRGESLRERYIATVDMATAVLWPGFAGIAVLAGPAVEILYGRKWIGAALPLSILSIASILLTSVTMSWEVFAATGKMRVQTRIELVWATLSTALFAAASPFGLVAAAGSRVVSSVAAILLYRPHLDRMTNTGMADLWRPYLSSILLTLLATAPGLVVMTLHGFSPDVPLLEVVFSVGAGILSWTGGLFAMRHRLVSFATERLSGVLRARRSAADEAAPGT